MNKGGGATQPNFIRAS